MFSLTYKGKSFNQRETDSYINLGQLCSTHDKKLSHWSTNKSANAYLDAVSQATGIPVAELIVVQNGVATWGHPLVAIEVARWINPDFGVWCNLHIKTLMETGKTVIEANWKNQLPDGNWIALISVSEFTKNELEEIQESRQQIIYDDEYYEVDDPIFAPDSDEFDCFYGDIEAENVVIETRDEKWIYFIWTGSLDNFAIKIGKCNPTKEHLMNRLQECTRWCPDGKLVALMEGTDKTETVLHKLFGKYFEKKREVFEGDCNLWKLITDIADKKFFEFDFFRLDEE